MLPLLLKEIRGRARLLGAVFVAIIILNFVLEPLNRVQQGAPSAELWQNLDLNSTPLLESADALEIIQHQGLWTGKRIGPVAAAVKQTTPIARHEAVRLVGVIQQAGMRSAHLVAANSKLIRVQEGDILPGGEVVTAISEDHVVLRNRETDSDTTIYLYSSKQAGGKD